ncbi:MAG TPA: LacI family DNA-binding transcriptional regulator [Anaeromyxobacteraceae bacterium]|nr:LacI family DNA-binding transcriptional regulator [Anaeromyxobacteraceae bacterium]
MATIVDVARRAGVSPSTVSHVLNRTRFVSADARRRVEEAVEALGYRPNALARSLRSGRSHTIGLVLPDSGNPFFAELAREIQLAAYDAGYSVVLCNTENDVEKERGSVALLMRTQVDGIVLVAVDERGDALRSLARQALPVVVMDRERPDLALDTVLTDHRQGGLDATRHLLALGHRRVACVAGPAGLSPSALRLGGYRQALEEAGLPYDAALVRHGDFHPASGHAAARALLALADPPTALFACNDLMAFGVLRAAAELDRPVPEALAVVGYDDVELAAFAVPPLTTVAQPRAEMGRAAVRLIASRVADPRLPRQQALLPVSLVVRRSSGERERRRAEGP